MRSCRERTYLHSYRPVPVDIKLGEDHLVLLDLVRVEVYVSECCSAGIVLSHLPIPRLAQMSDLQLMI